MRKSEHIICDGSVFPQFNTFFNRYPSKLTHKSNAIEHIKTTPLFFF